MTAPIAAFLYTRALVSSASRSSSLRCVSSSAVCSCSAFCFSCSSSRWLASSADLLAVAADSSRKLCTSASAASSSCTTAATAAAPLEPNLPVRVRLCPRPRGVLHSEHVR